MRRDAAVFAAGAAFLAATEALMFMRAVHRALSGEDEDELTTLDA